MAMVVDGGGGGAAQDQEHDPFFAAGVPAGDQLRAHFMADETQGTLACQCGRLFVIGSGTNKSSLQSHIDSKECRAKLVVAKQPKIRSFFSPRRSSTPP